MVDRNHFVQEFQTYYLVAFAWITLATVPAHEIRVNDGEPQLVQPEFLYDGFASWRVWLEVEAEDEIYIRVPGEPWSVIPVVPNPTYLNRVSCKMADSTGDDSSVPDGWVGIPDLDHMRTWFGKDCSE